jgi:hypothetical protein
MEITDTNYIKYRKYMFKYGILSILFVLEHFEENENFEECKNIIDTIKKEEERLGIKLFTNITQESIEIVKVAYRKFSMTGLNVIENSKYYSLEIIEEINNEKLKSNK